MKICFTAGPSGLDAPVDIRHGLCPFSLVVEMTAKSYPTPAPGPRAEREYRLLRSRSG
jgi:hypothetical protein